MQSQTRRPIAIRAPVPFAIDIVPPRCTGSSRRENEFESASSSPSPSFHQPAPNQAQPQQVAHDAPMLLGHNNRPESRVRCSCLQCIPSPSAVSDAPAIPFMGTHIPGQEHGGGLARQSLAPGGDSVQVGSAPEDALMASVDPKSNEDASRTKCWVCSHPFATTAEVMEHAKVHDLRVDPSIIFEYTSLLLIKVMNAPDNSIVTTRELVRAHRPFRCGIVRRHAVQTAFLAMEAARIGIVAKNMRKDWFPPLSKEDRNAIRSYRIGDTRLLSPDNVLPRSVLFIRRSRAEIMGDETARMFLLRHNWKQPELHQPPMQLVDTTTKTVHPGEEAKQR